jgi:peptidylprolyl isomerase
MKKAAWVVPALLAALLLAAACGDDGGEETPDVSPAAAAPPGDGGAVQPDDCPAPSGDVPEIEMQSYSAPPEMAIDPSRSYAATVHTVRGSFTMELLPGVAPQHVNSFVFLAREGFYDGVTFHRVVPDFVAQAGDPTGTGAGGPGYTLPLEPSDIAFERGVVGMARTNDPNSAGSQWFVTLARSDHLNGQYTVFGRVTEGMDVVDCIAVGDAITGIEVNEE